MTRHPGKSQDFLRRIVDNAVTMQQCTDRLSISVPSDLFSNRARGSSRKDMNSAVFGEDACLNLFKGLTSWRPFSVVYFSINIRIVKFDCYLLHEFCLIIWKVIKEDNVWNACKKEKLYIEQRTFGKLKDTFIRQLV